MFREMRATHALKSAASSFDRRNELVPSRRFRSAYTQLSKLRRSSDLVTLASHFPTVEKPNKREQFIKTDITNDRELPPETKRFFQTLERAGMHEAIVEIARSVSQVRVQALKFLDENTLRELTEFDQDPIVRKLASLQLSSMSNLRNYDQFSWKDGTGPEDLKRMTQGTVSNMVIDLLTNGHGFYDRLKYVDEVTLVLVALTRAKEITSKYGRDELAYELRRRFYADTTSKQNLEMYEFLRAGLNPKEASFLLESATASADPKDRMNAERRLNAAALFEAYRTDPGILATDPVIRRQSMERLPVETLKRLVGDPDDGISREATIMIAIRQLQPLETAQS